MMRIRILMAVALFFLASGCATSIQEVQVTEWRDPMTEMEFVFLKGACYEMGDTFGDGYDVERPVHEVCIGDFWIGKYEVTQGQWERVMGNNPSKAKSGDRYPVENVDWYDVQEFIQSLNLQTGKRFQLPTEAEWEYAARSGGKHEKWAGTNDESHLEEYAWYVANSKGTHPVGQKRPNGLGLYDMSGNVWEWVQDYYNRDYYAKSPRDNPQGPSWPPSYRVLRGGCWNDQAKNIRTTNRSGAAGPPARNPFAGFRLVLSAQ